MLSETGVDIVSFGATKGGTMFGESIVVLNDALKKDARAVQLSSAQLNAKTRYVAAQFDAFLAGDLWITRARHANEMASLLAQQLGVIDGVEVWPCAANMVFATVPDAVVAGLEADAGMVPYQYGTNVMRWVAAWDTTAADVGTIVNAVNAALEPR